MKLLKTLIVLGLLQLSGCVVVPHQPHVVYSPPSVGYVWVRHPSYGWGWRHPHHGWHNGRHPYGRR